MIPNLAAIVQQAQSMGLDQNNSAVAPQPNNGGTVVGTGTSVNDLSYFLKPFGLIGLEGICDWPIMLLVACALTSSAD